LAYGLVLWGAGFFPGPASGQGESETDTVQEVPMEIPADLLEPAVLSRSGPGNRLARMISADLRRLETRQAEIVAELEGLPQFSLDTISPVEFGYHASPNRKRPKWVQLDFGQTIEPDAVALVPVTVQFEGRPVPGYGFPRAFRLDISEDENFSSYETLVERGDEVEDWGAPRQAPFFAKTPSGASGRYIRLTVTRLWKPSGGGGAELFALAELMVLKGQRNLALGKPVATRDSVERNPLWAKRFVNDGRTPLGIPYSPEISPSFGYSSRAGKKVDKKWVQVDLGEVQVIDEVRLIPADPDNYVFDLNTGFPKNFSIQVSDDPEFRDKIEVVSFSVPTFRNPGNNPVTFPVDKVSGRYVRIVVRKVGKNEGLTFALAEMQVFSGDVNVALGKKVTSVDSLEKGKWGVRYLVDGYSSRYRLSGLPEWLGELDKRGELIGEWRELDARRTALADQAVSAGIKVGTGFLVLCGVLLVFGILRSRVKQLKKMESLRNQIASDLHDDIGSNLSSIALLAELGRSEMDEPDLARSEFEQIKQTADRTVESMKDIVWLIRPGDQTWGELLARFRETAAQLLKGQDYEFAVEGEEDTGVVPLGFRRDLFLIFKEVLNNIVKHAEASKVEIHFTLERGRLSLAVKDNGQGFSEKDEGFRRGNGLQNIRRRAQHLGAELDVESRQGEGTRVRLVAVLP
jgi:signal transduction histidine kinase